MDKNYDDMINNILEMTGDLEKSAAWLMSTQKYNLEDILKYQTGYNSIDLIKAIYSEHSNVIEKFMMGEINYGHVEITIDVSSKYELHQGSNKKETLCYTIHIPTMSEEYIFEEFTITVDHGSNLAYLIGFRYVVESQQPFRYRIIEMPQLKTKMNGGRIID